MLILTSSRLFLWFLTSIFELILRHKDNVSPEAAENYFCKVLRQIGEGKRTFSDYATGGASIEDMAMGVSLYTEDHFPVEEMNKLASVCTSKLLTMANEYIEKFISWWKGKNLRFEVWIWSIWTFRHFFLLWQHFRRS